MEREPGSEIQSAGSTRMAAELAPVRPFALLLPWSLLVGGVVLAVISRVLIVLGGLPGITNFLHFPLITAAYLLSRSRAAGNTTRNAERALAVSAVLTIASLAGSVDSSFLRALLVWPILVEPIVVILTIWHLSAAGVPSRSFRTLGMLVVLGQLPIAIGQALTAGIGDPVQGTLIRQGAGHHVLGAIGLMVALICLATIISKKRPVLSWTGAGAASGFSLAVLTDMKQGIVAFFAAGLFLLIRGLRERRREQEGGPRSGPGWLGTVVGIGTLVVLVLVLNTFVILSKEPWRFTAPFDAKGAAISTITEEMNRNPMGYLVGLGPGTTATRVAWLTAPMAGPSALEGFGLDSTPIATDLARQWSRNPAWAQSSVSSPFSTWIGIYGDLGVLGLIAIVLLWWIPWSVARRSPEGLGAQAVILFTLLLGLFFNWMEEPILVIVAAVLIGAETAPLVGMESEVASRDVSSRAVTAS